MNEKWIIVGLFVLAGVVTADSIRTTSSENMRTLLVTKAAVLVAIVAAIVVLALEGS